MLLRNRCRILSSGTRGADDDPLFVLAGVVIEGATAGNEGQTLVRRGTDDLLNGGGVQLVELVCLHPVDGKHVDCTVLAGDFDLVPVFQLPEVVEDGRSDIPVI